MKKLNILATSITICLLTIPAFAGETRITFIFGADGTEVLKQRANFVAGIMQDAKPDNPVDAIASDGKAIFSLNIDSRNRLKVRRARQKAIDDLREFYLQKSKSTQKPAKNDIPGGMAVAVGRYNADPADRQILVILSSGLYWDDYMDLRDGFPSDSITNTAKEDSPYSIIPVNQTGRDIEVIFVTNSGDYRNTKHLNRISRFYSLLCHSRRMKLVGFTPDYQAAASLIEKPSKIQKPVPQAEDPDGPLILYRIDGGKKYIKKAERKGRTISVQSEPQILSGSVLSHRIYAKKSTLWLSIRDSEGTILTDIKPEHLRVVETINGQSKQIPPDELELEPVKDRRMAIVLNRDVSPSMSPQALVDSRKAIEDFADNHMREGDIVALIEFHGVPEISCTFTSDPQALKKSIVGCSIPDGTALYDALLLSIYTLSENDSLGCIVAFTDGDDTSSRFVAADVLSAAQGAFLPLFLVGFGDVRENVLKHLAEETGGLYVPASDASELSRIFGNFSDLLTSSLVLTYPSSAKPGQTVKVDVIVDDGNLRGRLSSAESIAQ